jgi:CheY-like chemotaxis protein
MPESNRVILVVEDVPIIRMTAVDLLLESGFAVLEAESAD